jgi:Ca2+-binding RTX toxin-like protein
MAKIIGDDTNNDLTGTENDDIIRGNGGDDTISGLGGNDELSGGLGNDTIHGGLGNDTIIGGRGDDHADGGDGDDVFVLDASGGGNDVLDGGDGRDTLDFSATISAVTVDMRDGTASGTEFGTATFANFEVVNGGNGDDQFTGSTAGDTLHGGNGNDTLIGFDGDDDLDGGDGEDHLLGGIGNDTLTGGAGKDTLKGNDGDDTLFGGDQRDVLIGGLGADTMNSGAGHDIFKYGDNAGVAQSTSVNYDTLVEFNASEDVIGLWFNVGGIDTAITTGRLDQATYDADLSAAVNGTTMAAGHAVFFTPDSGSDAGELYLVVDVNGVAGYQASQDLVFEFDDATNMGSFSLANFA